MTNLNPLSPENLQNPAPFYTALRETSPLHWSDEVQVWIISRYNDVANAYRDPRLSSERSGLYEYQMMQHVPDRSREFGQITSRMMLNRDGLGHLNIRRQASPGFAPQALDSYVPAIRRIMETQLDQVQSQGNQMDLVKEVSYLLPPLVIAEILHLPVEHRVKFLEWSAPLSEFFTPKAGSNMKELAKKCMSAMDALCDYLGGVINERRQHPGHDMLSQMIQAQQEGKMSHEEVVANALLMLTAGHNTTTDQISNGIHDLLTHPEEMQKLREDPSLAKSAVEEMLRFNPSVPFMTRIAKQDIEMYGKTIRQGQVVFLGMAAANRDPEVFPEPDRFDVTRDHNHQKHLTFAFGPHHCMGAGLARRELMVATEVLLNRLPELRLDETRPLEPKWLGLVFRGYTSLPVRW